MSHYKENLKMFNETYNDFVLLIEKKKYFLNLIGIANIIRGIQILEKQILDYQYHNDHFNDKVLQDLKKSCVQLRTDVKKYI